MERLKLVNDDTLYNMVKLSRGETSDLSYVNKIMSATNENINEVKKIIPFDNKRILMTTSSGDQFMSCPNSEIVLYDNNYLTLLFSKLKYNAMLAFGDNNIFEKFIINNDENSHFLDKKYLKEIPDSEIWLKYLKEVDYDRECISNLILKISEKEKKSLHKLTPFYSADGYNTTRNLLLNKEFPQFFLGDCLDLYKKDVGVFDIVYLSNITEFLIMMDVYNLDLYPHEAAKEIITTIIKRFSTILNDDGYIVVDYSLDAKRKNSSWKAITEDKRLTIHEFDSGINNTTSAVAVYKMKHA